MGCDIHCHIEVKVAGKWEHYSVPSVPRNYELFALMANVRNRDGQVKPIATPKGIPDDITTITRLAYAGWGEDAHSASWLSNFEVSQLRDEWERRGHGFKGAHDFEHDFFGYVEGISWVSLQKWPEEHGNSIYAWIEDFRFVFWFDN